MHLLGLLLAGDEKNAISAVKKEINNLQIAKEYLSKEEFKEYVDLTANLYR